MRSLNIKKSLATRLVFWVLLFCISLFLITLILFYHFSKRQLEEVTLNNATSTAGNMVLKTEQVIQSITVVADNYRVYLERMTLHPDSLPAITKMVVANNKSIMGCSVAFEPSFFPEKGLFYAPYSIKSGDKIESRLLGDAEYTYFYMDWYQIPMMLERSYWSEPYYDNNRGNALITTYSIPFRRTINGVKKVVGVISFDLALDWFTSMVSSVKILDTGYASVLSRNGTFITHPKHELIMNHTIFSYAAELNNPELRSIGRKMQRGESGIESSTVLGVERKIYFTPLPSNNWTLAVVFPVSEMYAPLRQISYTLFILISTALTMLTLIVYQIVKKQLAPLEHFARSAREVANGNFNNPLPEIKTKDEMKNLHDSFETMQKDLQLYVDNLTTMTSAKEKIESELRIAREIQMSMIPKIFPPFPDLKELDLFAMLQPAKEVGGDLYDFFLIDKDHLCFAIGDVSGKGVPASLFMAVTRTLLRSVAPNQLSTRSIVHSLNQSLSSGNDSSMFVTFFIGILTISTGEIVYTNAGHNPPLILTPDGKAGFFPVSKEIPIGLYEEANYTEHQIRLARNEKILLYTDGVTEAENSMKELFGENRLLEAIKGHTLLSTSAIIEKVCTSVATHVKENDQSDDLTMLCIVYHGV